MCHIQIRASHCIIKGHDVPYWSKLEREGLEGRLRIERRRISFYNSMCHIHSKSEPYIVLLEQAVEGGFGRQKQGED